MYPTSYNKINEIILRARRILTSANYVIHVRYVDKFV